MNTYEGNLNGKGLVIGIVCSRFNDLVTQSLASGARDALLRHGVDEDSITMVTVPGALELGLAAQRLAQSSDFDAIVCVGAVIRGATDHYGYVAGQCATAIQQAQLASGVPIAFGVLTTDSLEQAFERAGAKAGNMGFDAAVTAIEMADLIRQLSKSHSFE